MAQIPHFDLPFAFVLDPSTVKLGVGVVEQDSTKDVMNCVECILRYPKGFRPEAFDFGINDLTFQQQQVDISDVIVQVERFEPRAHVVFEENMDAVDVLVQRITALVTGGTQNL